MKLLTASGSFLHMLQFFKFYVIENLISDLLLRRTNRWHDYEDNVFLTSVTCGLPVSEPGYLEKLLADLLTSLCAPLLKL